MASAASQHQRELMRRESDAQALLREEKSALQKLRGVLQQTEIDAARQLSDQQRETHQEKLNQAEEVLMFVMIYSLVTQCKLLSTYPNRTLMPVLYLVTEKNPNASSVSCDLKEACDSLTMTFALKPSPSRLRFCDGNQKLHAPCIAVPSATS